MSQQNPTELVLKGDRLVVASEGTQSSLRPGSQPRPFQHEPMILRHNRFVDLAREVIRVILEKSLDLAEKEFRGMAFEPKSETLAPPHFRRRTERANDWPLEGIVGATGPSNWKNIVNLAVKGKLALIDLSQNNGKWVLEAAEPSFDTDGGRDVFVIDFIFVDLKNAEDLEWENGAPRKATKPTVQVLVQRENGNVEAPEQPRAGAGLTGMQRAPAKDKPPSQRKAPPPPAE